jgi:DNA-binding MarR family transcriptional regulator
MPPPATDSAHLANLIGAFVIAVGDELARSLEDASPDGPAAIMAIDTWTDESIDFLSGALGLTHSGTVRLVDRLVAGGLAVKRPGIDGRTVAVRLTARGRAQARTLRARRYRVLDSLVASLSPTERRTVGIALSRWLASGSRSRVEARRACRLCDHPVCRGARCPIGMSAGAP